MTDDAQLASNYKVSSYRTDVDAKNRDSIADAIHRRFSERYLQPVLRQSVHGFAKMAVACLMIGALESFRRGWPDTKEPRKGEHAFCSFFDSHANFATFRGHAQEFYKGVRCGILHQAETTRGWRIRRDAPEMLTEAKGIRTINATKFVEALQAALNDYRDELKVASWGEELWINLRTKMNQVCKNCESL